MSRHLQQTKTTDLANLYTSTILANGIAEPIFNFALIFLRAHIDEIDNDQAAEIANTQLARDFIRRFEVSVESRCFDITTLGGARRVDIDRDQRFGVIDNDAAASWQVNIVRKCRFDL